MINLQPIGLDAHIPARREHHCVAVALALHELTDWPLYCFIAYEVDFGAQVLASHAVVESPRGFFDLGGPEALERWWEGLCAEDPRGDLSLVDVAVRTTSVELLRDCALEEDIAGTDSDLDGAVRQAMPVARAALRQHGFEPLQERAANAS